MGPEVTPSSFVTNPFPKLFDVIIEEEVKSDAVHRSPEPVPSPSSVGGDYSFCNGVPVCFFFFLSGGRSSVNLPHPSLKATGACELVQAQVPLNVALR